MKNKHIPEIRFQGFTGDWEQRELGDWIVPFTEKTDRNNQYPVLTSSRQGIFLQTDYYKGNQIASEDNTGYNIVPRGYFTYRHMSDDEIFKFNINNIVDYGIVSTLYPVFTTKKGLNSNFLQYQLNNGEEFQRYAILQKQGGSRTYMYLSKLEKLKLTIPELQEQTKIGNFFKQLDETIALHQQELTTLKQTKHGFLQKMFPKEGESVPEIRFPDFTGDWEQRKLGDITESYSGGTPSVGNTLYYGGNIPFIRSAEINSESTELFITEDGLNNSSAKMVEEGDILYALYGATSGEVGISKMHGAINQAILAIKPKFDHDPYFITQWLKKQKNTIINTYLQGGQGNLSGSIVKDLIITLPTHKDEQVKIGEFFKQLDDTITLHQRELDVLKETKKAFLQKMFV